MPQPKLFHFLFLITIFTASPVSAKSEDESPQRNLTGFESVDESQPLWEIGIAGGAFNTTSYPTSKERNAIALAAPYLVYRGDVLRIGDGAGIRAVVIEESDFELDISFGGAFSAESEDGSVRDGMPVLDYLLEVGPQLVYRLKDIEFKNGGEGRLKARLQGRTAFSTDFDNVDGRGFIVEPTISYQQRAALFEETSLNVAFNVVFATKKFQEYYYQVDDEFVTAERMQYDAKGGYLGSELSLSVSFPINNEVRGFLGGSAKFFKGAANENSPLYEEDITYSVGIGFIWRAYESEAKASW